MQDSTLFLNLTFFLFYKCNFVLSLQVIGFIYGLIIEQFGWTVYIVLAGFAVSCVVSVSPVFGVLWIYCGFTGYQGPGDLKQQEIILFPSSTSVDPASMAYVPQESSVLATSCPRE